jgi:hypothetical protein
MPTATDLVTDLPADFEVFGQAVATSMADLLGGTTGQVLSKTSNTDMDFTWVTSDDANAIQNTIVDAKGDLIGATAADTPARLAVGTNGQVLTADSSAATGLAWATASGGPTYVGCNNFVINGGLDIWQRGTSFTGTAPYYNADRWNGARAGAAAGATWSQQTITGNLGTTPAQGVLYSLRVARDSGNTSTAVIQTANGFESANSIPLAGQTVVMSFYAKAGANFSSASNALAVKLVTGTGINQNYLIAGYTGSANAISTTATLTTSWQRFQYTATLPTTATEVALDFAYTPVGTAGAADNFEITGVQLEIGSVATQFGRAGGSFGGELSLCQRYYWRQYGKSGNYSIVGNGFGNTSGTLFLAQIKNPVELRTEASSIDSSGLLAFNGNSLTAALTSITLDYANQTYSNFKGTVTCDAKAPQALILDIGTTKYIGFSAEL